jgi:chromosome segregation ATPase
MSASDQPRAESPEAEFWDRLDRLEGRHQRLQSQHDDARRGLERLSSDEAEEVQRAWRHYCEVIAELDKTAAEFEVLHR